MTTAALIQARCPECDRRVPTHHDGTRLLFARHARGRGRWPRTDTVTCDGSGWLVEDDEVIG